MSEWRSMADGAPPNTGGYLTCAADHERKVYRTGVTFWSPDAGWHHDLPELVTHWMPLPEPPGLKPPHPVRVRDLPWLTGAAAAAVDGWLTGGMARHVSEITTETHELDCVTACGETFVFLTPRSGRRGPAARRDVTPEEFGGLSHEHRGFRVPPPATVTACSSPTAG